jgi:Tol biopolymer transport system component
MSRAGVLPALLLAACATTPSPAPVHLQYIATARQFGPVSFRDPLGVLSPDGRTLAWSVQHHLYLQPVGGGPVRELATEPGAIQHLAWLPDSRGIAAHHRGRTPRWWRYDLTSDTHGPLFPAGQRAGSGAPPSDSLFQLAWSADGRRIAGVRTSGPESQIWILAGDSAEVIRSTAPLAHPVFAPDGHLACLTQDGKREFLRDPCTGGAATPDRLEAYGPVAFSPRGDTIYYAAPNVSGTLDLWARGRSGGDPVRLTSFARDAYAPTAARNGAVLFKTQTYRTSIGLVADTGGRVTSITSFQSETPSWDPSGRWIGITYGTWRRYIDDFDYPNIAQDNGIISAHPDTPLTTVNRVVDDSPSEDQSLCWSPNGKWIAYHSHKDQGDDIYLVPADKSKPARRITSFGRGFETGWPRWSPDGQWLVFDSDSRDTAHQSVIYVMGVDQESGAVTRPEQALTFDGFTGEAVHAEWAGASDRLAILGDESVDTHVILLAGREGGPARTLYRWKSEHLFSGLGVSPDGKWVAFIAPAPDQHFQLWRIPLAGGEPRQLTFDPSNKTQPAYSPDGKQIALTVWTYEMQFWLLPSRLR